MTVIRDAVIRIRTERASADQQSTVRSQQQATRAVKEHTVAVQQFGVTSVRSFANAGRGALQFGRAVALMVTSSEEDTQKLIQNLVKIEAGVAALQGGSRLFKFAAAFGPVGIAVTAVATAIGSSLLLMRAFQQHLENIAIEAGKAAAELVKLQKAKFDEKRDQRFTELGLEAEVGAIGIATALEPSTQLGRVTAERERLNALQQRLGAEAGFIRRHGPDTQFALGGPQAIQEEITRREKERADVLRDLIDLEKQEAELKQHALQPQQTAIRDAFGFIPGIGGALDTADAVATQAKSKEILNESQKALDELLRLYRSARIAAEEERRKLEAGLPAK